MVIKLFHSCLGGSIIKTFFCKFIYNMAGTTAVHSTVPVGLSGSVLRLWSDLSHTMHLEPKCLRNTSPPETLAPWKNSPPGTSEYVL